MFTTIKEGMAQVKIPEEEKISKKLPIFYNPVMKFNRDMSVLVLKVLYEKNKKPLKIGDPLAGTGIRALRFLKELPEGAVESVWLNDYNPKFKDLVQESLAGNAIKQEKTSVSLFFAKQDKMRTTEGFTRDVIESAFTAYNRKILFSSIDANLFLLLSPGFDYIDIDPFGTPNPFLDASCMRLARNGILAVTATDTSALCGTYRLACERKYWAKPMHNEIMHEIGLRILIRKVQLVAAQYDKALVPIFSYDRDHYMRIFFRCDKGKKRVDDIVKQHAMFEYEGQVAGPIWVGQLWDSDIVKEMVASETDDKNKKFLQLLHDESKIPIVGFHDIHALCKRHSIKNIPRMDKLTKNFDKNKISWSRTHFSLTGLRTTGDVLSLLKQGCKKNS
ncbi:MAG: hypothetical protein ABIJ21_07065 [Nanoarchaeota archaeon]